MGHCFVRCLILWCNFLWEVSGEGRRLWYRNFILITDLLAALQYLAAMDLYRASGFNHLSRGISQEAFFCAETQWTGQDWMDFLDWTDLDHWTKLDDSTELDWTGLIWTEWTYWTDFDWRALTGVDWTWLTGLDWTDWTGLNRLTWLDWTVCAGLTELYRTGLDWIWLG